MNKNFKFLKKDMNKRGQLDIIFFAIVVVAIAIFALIINYVIGSVTDGLLNSPLNQSAEAVAALNAGKSIVEKFDYVWLVIFIGLLLGVLVSSVLIDVHWIFIPIWIILMGISVLVGAIMNNLYAEFVANPILYTKSDMHPFANAIINHYVLTIIGVAVLSFVLIFGKNKLQGQRL